MSEFYRPPLHPITCEEIDMLLHKIDQQYWPVIAKMKVAKFIPLSIPVPPQAPLHLLDTLNLYARDLFTSEADYYEQFHNDGRYPAWLSKLMGRVVTRVLNAVDKIEQGDSVLGNLISTLAYHGITQPQMEKTLRESLGELTNRYTQRDSGPQVQTNTLKGETAKIAEPQARGIEDSQDDTIKSPLGNRERIDKFILKMATSGLEIKRKDIWRAAGYKDRTEFERFQRGEEHNKSASLSFNRLLNLEPDNFRELLKRKS